MSGNIPIQIKSIRENKGDLTLVDESLQGQNVTLAASHDIDLGAATNTQILVENYNSKGSSLGMTITGGAISGVDASFSKEKQRALR
ncbi:hemagglutinin repeat-containing protein [Megasphaera massiliensis]|uniref:hemagglutinin repeat-containing protein n=1 Tax=Megasphaera massiliensis TaxID=1232428 RepID=UPI00399958A9